MDVIQALCDWSKEFMSKEFPNVEMGWAFAQTTATDQSNTARFTGDHAPTLHQTFAVNWYIGEFCGHVEEDEPQRSDIAKAVMEEMLLCGEIPMPDGSPMFIKQVRLEQGQIHLTGQYGVLVQSRRKNDSDKLTQVGMDIHTCEDSTETPLKNLEIHGGMHG